MIEAAELLDVQLIYALPGRHQRDNFSVPVGTTARTLVVNSRFDEKFPGLSLTECPIGIYGKRVDDNYQLKANDRVEIYRPLASDPQELRIARAGQSARLAAGKNRRA